MYVSDTERVCTFDRFNAWPTIHRNGTPIQVISTSVHLTACERICRLRIDCVGFNMNWTEQSLETGYCTILTAKTNWLHPEKANDDLVFYGKLE